MPREVLGSRTARHMQTRAEETGEGPTPAHPEPSRSATGDLPRYQGPRAEIAHYSGVLLDAQAADERDREREACVKLAHLYTQRGTNLDAAVALARRALAIQDDPALRTEVAGWLAGLGDPAGAALELRGTPGGRAARAGAPGGRGCARPRGGR